MLNTICNAIYNIYRYITYKIDYFENIILNKNTTVMVIDQHSIITADGSLANGFLEFCKLITQFDSIIYIHCHSGEGMDLIKDITKDYSFKFFYVTEHTTAEEKITKIFKFNSPLKCMTITPINVNYNIDKLYAMHYSEAVSEHSSIAQAQDITQGAFNDYRKIVS